MGSYKTPIRRNLLENLINCVIMSMTSFGVNGCERVKLKVCLTALWIPFSGWQLYLAFNYFVSD